MKKTIEFENVCYKYDDENNDSVINNLNLSFYEGQFTCVLGHNGSGKSTMAKLINALLIKAVDMYEYRQSTPHRLSGGQKQRVAIAGIIAMEPECIVLDEPTAMLDPKGRREVINALHKLNDELGISVILVTHFMDEAVNADRVVVMNDGRVEFDGTPQEVFSHDERLREIGLSVPKPPELANELRKAGVDIQGLPLTADEFLEEYKKLVD